MNSVPSIITSAVANIAVTPAAEPFDVIVGRNKLEGVAANYRCTFTRVMLTPCLQLTFALLRKRAPTVLLGCASDRITNITQKWKHYINITMNL